MKSRLSSLSALLVLFVGLGAVSACSDAVFTVREVANSRFAETINEDDLEGGLSSGSDDLRTGDGESQSSNGGLGSESKFGSDSQGSSGSGSADGDSGDSRSKFDLTIVTQANKEKKDRVNLMFALDNSQSMENNLGKLSASVGKLFRELSEAKIDYTARIVSIDSYDRQLESHQAKKVVAAEKLFSGKVPSFDRSSSNESQYELKNSPIFQKDNSISEIEKAISESLNASYLMWFESLIAVSFDYIAWVINGNMDDSVPGIADGEMLHIVALSDEGNSIKAASSYNPYTGEPEELWDMIMYQEQVTTKPKMCVPGARYDREVEWKVYGYSWQDPAEPSYQYSWDHQAPTACQTLKPELYPNGSDEVYDIYIANNKVCEKSRSVKWFQCKNHNKASTSTRYSCSDGAGRDFHGLTYASYAGWGRCSWPTKVECVLKNDNQPVWVERDISEATQILAGGGTCRQIEGYSSRQFGDEKTSWSLYDNSNMGVSCREYSCWEQGSITSVPREEFTEEEMNATANLSECQYVRSSDEIETHEYFTLENSDDLANIEVTSGCQLGFSPRNLGTNLLIDSDVCGSALTDAIKSHLAAEGISISKTGTSLPNTKENKSRVFSASIADLDELSNKIGVPANELSNLNLETYNPGSPSAPITSYLLQESYSASFRASKVNFRELSHSEFGFGRLHKGFIGSDSYKPGACVPVARSNGTITDINACANTSNSRWQSLLANNRISEKKIYHPNGVFQDPESCTPEETKEKLYQPTAANFSLLMKRLFPTTTVTWHSIVHNDKMSCGGVGESAGTEYLALSEATKGEVADICDPDFSKFVDKVAYNIKNELVVVYPLPSDFDPAGRVVIREKSSRKVISATSYQVVDQNVVFDKSAVKPGEVFEIEYQQR